MTKTSKGTTGDDNLGDLLGQRFLDQIAHSRELGLEMIRVDQGSVTMRLPYSDKLVGNPETGVLHGGAITTLIDNAAGAAVFAAIRKARPIGTLDLRIDYLKPVTPGRDVFTLAECYKVTRQIAFVRAIAYHEDPDDPVANCVATFMLDIVPGNQGQDS